MITEKIEQEKFDKYKCEEVGEGNYKYIKLLACFF